MIYNGILLWGKRGPCGFRFTFLYFKGKEISIIHLQWISKEVDMIWQANGEGYGLFKNVERHWISQIWRNLREQFLLTCKRCGGSIASDAMHREKAGMGRVVFENIPPLIFLLSDYWEMKILLTYRKLILMWNKYNLEI